jgi:hypothetical protein
MRRTHDHILTMVIMTAMIPLHHQRMTKIAFPGENFHGLCFYHQLNPLTSTKVQQPWCNLLRVYFRKADHLAVFNSVKFFLVSKARCQGSPATIPLWEPSLVMTLFTWLSLITETCLFVAKLKWTQYTVPGCWEPLIPSWRFSSWCV